MQRLELLPMVLDHQNFFQNSTEIIPRNTPVSPCLDGSEINLICGPLHAGKTSFLRQVAKLLQGVKVYINFEDSRLKELGPEDLEEIMEIIVETYGREAENGEKPEEEGTVCYFLDEIQYVPGWESWIDRLYSEGARVFVASSSNLMSQEISSRFAGRLRVLKLFPFSFKEYLTLRGLRVPRPNFLTPSRCDDMLCLFLQYFDNGGFPDVIKNGDFRLSGQYFGETLEKEIISRYDIQYPEGLKRLAVFLISNMASEYSLDTLKKVSGTDSDTVIRSYLDYLEEVFLMYRIPIFNHISEISEKRDGKENEKEDWKEAPCKIYAGDTGFFKSVSPNYPDSLGLRFENLVLLELLRQGKDVYYFRDRNECDFLITEKGSKTVTAAIQVSIYFGGPVVREREVLGLLAAMEKYGLKEGFILTMDDEGAIEVPDENGEKRKIIINSVWKWMLE